ncbi:MAG: hypothetical protein IT331_15335 [Anaerolineae bacterium]|nr:hypothetical protein [Anaerolineae bacterium]
MINYLEKVRRNHGIEHATVHVLSEATPNLSLVGRADGGGFAIIGDVEPETLAAAAQEALRRMKAGQGDLAVHPRCGTQLVTIGALTACAAFFALGRRPRLSKLPDAMIATTLATFLAPTLGMTLQKYVTTSPNVFAANFAGVSKRDFAGISFWHVDIAWEENGER